MGKQTVNEKIQQRRLQILVHSYLYYVLNESIVSDEKWSRWAHELVRLQEKYPNKSKKIIYHEMFENFNGSTGMDFVYDEDIINRAQYLLAMHDAPKVKPKKKVKVQTKKRRLF